MRKWIITKTGFKLKPRLGLLSYRLIWADICGLSKTEVPRIVSAISCKNQIAYC